MTCAKRRMGAGNQGYSCAYRLLYSCISHGLPVSRRHNGWNSVVVTVVVNNMGLGSGRLLHLATIVAAGIEL